MANRLADNLRLTDMYPRNGYVPAANLPPYGMVQGIRNLLTEAHNGIFFGDFATAGGVAITTANLTVGDLRGFLGKLRGAAHVSWEQYVASDTCRINEHALGVWLKVAGLPKKALSATAVRLQAAAPAAAQAQPTSSKALLVVAAQDASVLVHFTEDLFDRINSVALNAMHMADQMSTRDNSEFPKTSNEFIEGVAAVRLEMLGMADEVDANTSTGLRFLAKVLEEVSTEFRNYRKNVNDFDVKALTDKKNSVLGTGSFAHFANAVLRWYSQQSVTATSYFDTERNKHKRTFMYFTHTVWVFGRFHAGNNTNPALARIKSLLRVYQVKVHKRPATKDVRDSKRQKQREADVDAQACFRCHQPGHKSNECPTRASN